MNKIFKDLFILIPIVSLFILSSTYYSCASDENIKNCSQIKKEIETVLNGLIPDVKIIQIDDAPIDGLCEIALESKGRKGIVYVDISRQYLVSGSILNMNTKENLTQAKLTEINKIDVSQIPRDNALVMGDKEAKHRVIAQDYKTIKDIAFDGEDAIGKTASFCVYNFGIEPNYILVRDEEASEAMIIIKDTETKELLKQIPTKSNRCTEIVVKIIPSRVSNPSGKLISVGETRNRQER